MLTLWLRSNVPLRELPEQLVAWTQDFGTFKAIAIYMVLYLVRPLILFPSSILGIASGVLFGPWLGAAVTLLGENAGANLAFAIARNLGQDWVQRREKGVLKRWDHRLAERGILSVLAMRLLLPFDAVSFACGLTSIRHRDFALGTALGVLPLLTFYVLLGGSTRPDWTGVVTVLGFQLSPGTLLLCLSALLLVLATGVGIMLKRLLPRRSQT